ncbi:hypothetical protein RUND412_009924 [Rhizina undulata]
MSALSRQLVRPRPSMGSSAIPAILINRPQKRNLTLQELDESKGNRQRVLILGSGWGGFGLARRLDLKHWQPIIVTPRTYFVFTPLLASTAVGTLEFRTAMESSRSIKGVEAIRGWAEGIDFANKTIVVEGAVEKRPDPKKSAQEIEEGEVVGDNKKFRLGWDKMVIAVGAYAQTFGIPGVKEHAFFLKDVGDARKIRRRVLECFEEACLPTASEERRFQLLHFAIIGGGPTGVEFAAELHDLITEDLTRVYPSLIRYPRITVYDISPRILSMFDSTLAHYAEKLFARRGITIKTSHHVTKLEDGAVFTKEEGRVPVGGVVWSTGLAGNPLIAEGLDGEVNIEGTKYTVARDPKKAKVLVDERLRVKLTAAQNQDCKVPHPDVFALGDCASFPENLPATAQVASQQARYLARVFNSRGKRRAVDPEEREKRLEKSEILKLQRNQVAPFKFRSLGIMAYLGGWKAITQSSKAEAKGRLAWVLWRTAYLSKSVSWRNRVLIPVYWVLNWLMGRDINRF